MRRALAPAPAGWRGRDPPPAAARAPWPRRRARRAPPASRATAAAMWRQCTLHPLAPGVEGFVARLPIGRPKRLARLAVGVAETLDQVVELDLGDGVAGEQPLRLAQAQQRLPPAIRAGLAAEALAVRRELAQPLGCARRHGVEPALELAQGLAHHIQVARSRQQLADPGQALCLPAVEPIVEARLDQPQQRPHALQAAPGVMDRGGDVVLAGELRLGDLDLLEPDAAPRPCR